MLGLCNGFLGRRSNYMFQIPGGMCCFPDHFLVFTEFTHVYKDFPGFVMPSRDSKLSWLWVFRVCFTKLAFRTSHVLLLRECHQHHHAVVPRELWERLCTRASHNSGTPIKYLVCRNSPRCIKSQHKGYSCVVSLTRGRRCQPRPVPSLTEAAVSLLNITVRWQTWVRLLQDFSIHRCVLKVFY